MNVEIAVTMTISFFAGIAVAAIATSRSFRQYESAMMCAHCRKRRSHFCPQCVNEAAAAAMPRDTNGKFAKRC